MDQKLSRGSFGKCSAHSVSNSGPRALKLIDVRGEGGCVDSRRMGEARREERVWRTVGSHPNCVEMFQSFMDGSVFCLVMERCEVPLIDRLVELTQVCENVLAPFIRQMLLGIAHIHQRLIVHRNVKPEKFFVGGPGGCTVKLSDFALAAQLPKPGATLMGSCGTAGYMSPEMAGGSGHSESTDVWSLGVTVYMLLYGELPYMPTEASSLAMKRAVLNGAPAPKFVRVWQKAASPSVEAESFVRATLERMPWRRCTAKEALGLPFLDPLSFAAEVIQKMA